MARKARDSITQSQPPDEKSTSRDRVRWLLDHLFGGNQSAMARRIGYTHTAIIKIVRGDRSPGRGLLSALAEHPKVNPVWLMTGRGEPLLAHEEQPPRAGWSLPVATEILPGPPGRNPQRLTGNTWSFQGRPSQYLYECQGSEPVEFDERERIALGDRLLLDADHSLWMGNLRCLDGRVCAVRRNTPRGPIIVLVRVRCRIDLRGEAIKLTIALPPKELPRDAYGRERRVVELDDKPKKSPKKAKGPEETVLAIEDILAVAVLLVRQL